MKALKLFHILLCLILLLGLNCESQKETSINQNINIDKDTNISNSNLNQNHSDEKLKANDLEACSKIWNQHDPCSYVRKNCPELNEGFFNFIELHYCYLRPNIGSVLGVLLLVSIVFLLFLMLGTIASDFFCPNLASIAEELKLSESVAGVTFLAFGNGSPDLFSTFSAFKANSGALAMGELIGAAWFIISVVVGSMAVVQSFQVIRKLFMRDILFFTGAVIFILIIVWDRKITLSESLGLILYYVIYVVTVVVMNWYGFKGENDNFKTIPSKDGDLWDDDEELEGLLLSNIESLPEEDEMDQANEATQLISDVRHSPNHLMVRNRRLPSLTPVTYYKRMNFWTADEIANAFNENFSGSTTGIPPLLRRRTEFLPTTAKLNSQIGRSLTAEVEPISSHSYTDSPSLLIPAIDFPSIHSVTNSLPYHGPSKFKRDNAPAFISIPEPGAINVSSPASLLDLDECQDDSEPTILANDQPGNSVVKSPVVDNSKPTTLFQLLFPGFIDWHDLNFYEKFINLISLPFILLFTLTVPTPLEKESLIENIGVTSPIIQPIYIQESNDDHTFLVPHVKYFRENLTAELVLGLLQAFTIPVFLFETILVSNDLADRQDYYWALIIGGIFSLIFLFITMMNHRYNTNAADYTLVRSLLGFSQSICWISMTATEVVDILRAFGIIFGISEEIIGLTVFAVGNSLGDFVANFAVARMGYPMMAVSACFAGPMLNMMLGPGIAGTYLGLFRNTTTELPVSHVMTSAGLGVLLVLLAYNIYLHYNNFKIGKKFGIGLIIAYFLGMTINLVLTIYRVY
ncbi:hypothetical protein K502DRAFT_350502 [Neoconidiobolus thromboides FSU 785]|nr:hypothetical protein K502DRAFT_350502 [Neoconidiobolus thromboides FSU 785]